MTECSISENGEGEAYANLENVEEVKERITFSAIADQVTRSF